MKVPERDLSFTEELSAKRTIIFGDVSSQGNDAKLVDIAVQHAKSSSNDEWLITIMNEGAAQSSSAGKKQPKVPKISKIPKLIRDIGSKDDCYDPLVVSIGPYHHGKDGLHEIQKLKSKMANQYVNATKDKKSNAAVNKKVEEVAGALYKKVEGVAPEAKTYYDVDPSSAIDDESFTRMMFLDGCFLLQYIYSSVYGQQDMGMKFHHTALVQRDLFLLENQLPYIVLKELMSMRFEENEGKNMIDKFIELNNLALRPPKSWFVWLLDFVNSIFTLKKSADQADRGDQGAKPPTDNSSSTQPLHLLDMMRKTFVGPDAEKALLERSAEHDQDNWSQRYQSAKELKTVGIWFRTSKSGHCSDVKFAPAMLLYGALTLPRLRIDDSTKSMLLNMVAFETCPDGPDDFWVTSYICFMDSLINNAEDVTVQRSQNILLNYLSSDQDVADLFNGIAKYLAPNPRAYVKVRKGIKAHCKNRFKKWMAEWLDTHFSSPWTVLAFLGAILAIVLSVIQTYVALNPPSN